jgi:hypothetical protein
MDQNDVKQPDVKIVFPVNGAASCSMIFGGPPSGTW